MIEIIGEREHRRFLLRIALMSAAERECEAEKKRIYILSELFHWTDLGSKGTRIIPGSGLIAEVSKCHAARCAADAPAIFVGSYSFSDETSLSIKKQGNAILVKKVFDLSKRLRAFGEVVVFQPTSISHACPSTCEIRASISRK